MISRYSRPIIKKIWSLENKYSLWLEIEILVAEKLSINGIIPIQAAKDIKQKGSFNIKEIELIEKDTKHDVVAFINNVSSYIGENAKYFHHGITSSDIVDTAFSIQLKQSAEIIISELRKLIEIIKKKALKYKNTVMIGRSHGVHAEPITFGLKLASFYCEFKRNLERLENAKKEIAICAISGPVGTYDSIDPSVENYVAKKMKLNSEKISTQVIPRDRHAVFFSTLGILASSIERLAIEIRNLQRTEISEVEEFFDKEQKGSSAMPHKRNPVLSENLTGLARYIRSAVIPSMENIALWHERDISHSSVERIFAPDITMATDFTIFRMSSIINNLIVYPETMKKNIDILGPIYKSQNILLALTQKGVSRQKAYQIVQSAIKKTSNSNQQLVDILNNDSEFNIHINAKELENLILSKKNIKYIDKIFSNIFNDNT
jgi:adenylosuccinate lyase